ncbi:MAG: hypothetical protein J6U20_00050 [Fibrobacter sp.]|nr:hypothetical protein [Fibrobacter sp.]
MQAILWTCVATISLTGCGDDESVSTAVNGQGDDYTLEKISEFSKYPCDETRESRGAVVGSEKERYECVYDSRDSVYLWVSDNDTLTAEGNEFLRAEPSSSSKKAKSSSSTKKEKSSSSLESSSSSKKVKSSSSSKKAKSSSSTEKEKSSSSLESSSSSKKVKSSSSSSEEKTINALLQTKGEQFNAGFTYGTMKDPRDGKTYKTTELNGQTWMAENLNYAGNKVGKSFCYGNDEDICEIYGRLYTREAAMNSASCGTSDKCNLGEGPIQGICPDEWHIPSVAEINALWDELDSTVNSWVSSNGWAIDRAGGDSYGLSFIPAGMDGAHGFQHLDSIASMWLYSPNGSQNYLVLNSETDKVFISDYSSYASVSVRCVKGGGIPPSSSSYSSSSLSSSSSKSLPTSSYDYYSIIEKKGDQFNPDADYGTMTDSRDGQTYKTVEVKGRVWMAENLNFAGNDSLPIVKQNSICYNDTSITCELFGRLYSREGAMNSDTCGYNHACSLGDTVQGACPDGWHIPSLAEINALWDELDSNVNSWVSKKGWRVIGEDSYGLSFLPTGNKRGDNFSNIGSSAFMWVNTPGAKQRYFVVNGNDERVFIHQGINDTALYLSIRCVKD